MIQTAKRRERPRLALTLPDACLWAAVGATLIIGPQLLGGVRPSGIVFHACGALAALGCALWVVGPSARLSQSFWGVLALWIWTALPAIPLPCGFTAILSPEATSQAQHAYSLVSDGALPYCTLSADPGNTREEVLKWTAILAMFLCAELLSVHGRRRSVLISVGLSGGLMTLMALGHLAAAADRIFGIYTPEHRGAASQVLVLAPLVNFNNLAGFTLLTGTVQFGLAKGAEDERRRLAWYAAAMLSAITVVLTLSRAGVAALFATALLLALRSASSRGQQLRNKAGDLGVVALAGLGATVIYAASDSVLNEFQSGGWDKFELWWRSLPVLWQQPWLGLGRGSFGAVFARMFGTTHRFKYVENFVLQWAIEWGIPVTLALVAAISRRLWRSLKQRRNQLGHRTATAVALLAYAGQNLFDLGLEVVSCACVAATALGTLSPRRPPLRPKGGEVRAGPGLRRAFSPLAFAISGLLALLLLAPTTVDNATQTIERKLQKEAKPDAPLTASTEETLVRGLRLHPQEPLLVYHGAQLLLAKDDPRAGRIINYGLVLSPRWAGSHVLAARFLVKRGHVKQGAMQLRQAAELDPRKSRALACLVADRLPQLTVELLPHDPEQLRRVMLDLVYCLPFQHPTQPELERRLMAGYPQEQVAFTRYSERLRRGGDFAGAESILKRQLEKDSSQGELWAALAQLYVHTAEPRKALDIVEQAERRLPLTVALLAARANAQALLGDTAGMEQTWSMIQGRAAAKESDLVYAYWLLGQLENTLGRRQKALNAFVAGYKINGNTDAAVGAAHICEQLGDKERALDWWRNACSSDPKHPVACEKARQLEQRTIKLRAE